MKSRWDVEVVAGNVATGEAAEALINAGADAVKIGVGPGSDLYHARGRRYRRTPDLRDIRLRGRRIPTRVQSSPTVASSIRGCRKSDRRWRRLTVMLGSLFAGVDESPGEVILYQGERYKEYRGMGSIGAMKARSFSKDRYFQQDIDNLAKFVPEGIEGTDRLQGTALECRLSACQRCSGGHGLLRHRRSPR
ncbi:MAG: IMP dehydrogenase [Thermomicrobiales bacterium]